MGRFRVVYDGSKAGPVLSDVSVRRSDQIAADKAARRVVVRPLPPCPVCGDLPRDCRCVDNEERERIKAGGSYVARNGWAPKPRGKE